MAVTYFIAVTLALFAGALPAQILGVIWASIQESMTVEIPYIALLRLLGCAGAIAAVILSERIRGYILARDLIVGAIALEALSLIGFSLSREFWNLCVWITALGFSAGLCLALISYLIRERGSRRQAFYSPSVPWEQQPAPALPDTSFPPEEAGEPPARGFRSRRLFCA